MAYKTVFEGVVFVEGDEPYVQSLGPVRYVKDGFYNQQLKNLDMVKHQMADKAKKLGANAIVGFKYGQKSAGWFRAALLSLDDNINWYGEGVAVRIDETRYNEILKEKSV